MLSLLPKDCPHRHQPWILPIVLDTSVYQTCPLTAGRVLGPLVHNSLVNIITLYLSSRLNAELKPLTPILNMGYNF